MCLYHIFLEPQCWHILVNLLCSQEYTYCDAIQPPEIGKSGSIVLSGGNIFVQFQRKMRGKVHTDGKVLKHAASNVWACQGPEGL
jgi:hypothetical protein